MYLSLWEYSAPSTSYIYSTDVHSPEQSVTSTWAAKAHSCLVVFFKVRLAQHQIIGFNNSLERVNTLAPTHRFLFTLTVNPSIAKKLMVQVLREEQTLTTVKF